MLYKGKSMSITYKQIALFLFFSANTLIGMEDGKSQNVSPIFSLEDYQKLSPYNIQQLEKEAQTILNITQKDIMMGKDNYYILRDPSNIDKLINAATELNNHYTNNVIVSFGQSPAYIVKTAEILNQLKDNSSNEYKYLAFSGRFFSASKETEQKPIKIFLTNYMTPPPTDNQLTIYEEYLKLLQLDPISIVKRFQKDNKQTVFIEYTQVGGGLASFIHTLMAIAQKEHISPELLKQAIIFHIFHTPQKYGPSPIQEITINTPPYASALLDVHKIDNDLMTGLGNADNFNDRLIVEYPLGNWEKINPTKFVSSRNAQLILFTIINHLMKKKKPY